MFNISSLLEDHGHEVIPFAMKHEKNVQTDYSKYFVENIDYEREIRKSIFRKMYIGLKIIYSLEAREKLLKLIAKEDPDIAHIYKISNTLTPSILYALKEKDVSTVQTLMDYRIVCPSYNMYDPNKFEVCEACKGHRYFNAVRGKCEKSSYLISLNVAIESYLYHFLDTYRRTIDLLISPSNFMKKKVIEFGVDRKKVVWIPFFVRPDQYVPNYSNSGYILYFGRLVRHKGVRTLITAMESVKSSKLFIVGEGTYRNELERFVRKNHIMNVAFLGYKSGNELTEFIRNSLFTVIPSEWYEPFGMTVLESYALGKPVIGAEIGGIPELVDSGSTGLLFRSGDVDDLTEKINYLLENKRLAVKMGRNARKKVEEKFNEKIHHKKLMEAYEKVL